MNIGLTEFRFRAVFAEFAMVLSQMPELGTVQILDAPGSTDRLRIALSQAMTKFVYPSVKTLTCSLDILDIAPHFPGVVHVTLLLGCLDDGPKGFQTPTWISNGCWSNVKKLDLSYQLYLPHRGLERSRNAWLYHRKSFFRPQLLPVDSWYLDLWNALPNVEELPFMFDIHLQDTSIRQKWASHKALRCINFGTGTAVSDPEGYGYQDLRLSARSVIEFNSRTYAPDQQGTVVEWTENPIAEYLFPTWPHGPKGLPYLLKRGKTQESIVRLEGQWFKIRRELIREQVWYSRYPFMAFSKGHTLMHGSWQEFDADMEFVPHACAPRLNELLVQQATVEPLLPE